MTIDTFLKLAQRYTDLGSSIQEQINDLVNEVDEKELNENAVKEAKEFLEDLKKETEY